MQQKNRSFLVDCFEIFYSKVLIYKIQILNNNVFSKEASDAEKRNKVEEICDELCALLKEQSGIAASMGGSIASSCFEEAAYIMAALADEIFLNLNWAGKIYWRNYLMEQKYFNSHIAGIKFFENLAKFISERDSQKSDIGLLYLYVLGLGFKGKYQDREPLQVWKNKIFQSINHAYPSLYEKKDSLFPQSKQYTCLQKNSHYDNTLKKWGMMGSFALLLYLFVAQVIWHEGTSELQAITKKSFFAMKDIS